MYSGLLKAIKNSGVIPLSQLKPYLWQDEIQDPFLLTRKMEIFLYNDETLGLYLYSSQNLSLLRKKCQIWHIVPCSDIIECHTKIENLPLLLHWGSFKRRPQINGKWLKKKEELLGHKILPYNPEIIKKIVQRDREKIKSDCEMMEKVRSVKQLKIAGA